MSRLLYPAVACLVAALLTSAAPFAPARAQSRDLIERAYRANNVGVAWLERFEYQKATDSFRGALRLAPSLGIARFNLALALFYDGKLEAAEQEGKAAAAAMPGSAAPTYLSGLIAKADGRSAGAAAAFARVAQADPWDVGAHVMLGLTRLQQGDAAGAIPHLRAALDLEPFNATAAYNLSVALARAGRSDEGRQMLGRFQGLRESGTATTLGNGYLEQGRYGEAMVSTGAERELVDRTIPRVRFTLERALRIDMVSPAVDPAGKPFEPGELDGAGQRRIAASLSGGIALFDFDGDGDLDVVEAAPDRTRLWRNTAGRLAEVRTARFARASPDAIATAVVAGDYNNDGRQDVLVLRYGAITLYRNDGRGRFGDVTAVAGLRLGATELPLTAAFADVDHDGDLDLVLPGSVDLDGRRAGKPLVFPHEFPAAPTRLWRNNGNGTFADVTTASGLSAAHATSVVPTDYDEGRDVDLLIAGESSSLGLFKNLRNGAFREVGRQAGLSSSGRATALAAGDVNRDGRPDFLIGRSDGPALLALSVGSARFQMEPAPGGLTGATAVQFLDYDGDGLLDLFAWTSAGPRLLRSIGDGWQDVSAPALDPGIRGLTLPSVTPGRAVAIGDLDGDGDEDVVVRERTGLRVLRNDGGNRRGAFAVRLAARVSNRSAAGSKVEMRAGSLKQRRETYAATPAPAAVDLVFGLGDRPSVDAVRVLWPAGIVQAELQPVSGRTLLVTELNRKPSSCPYLFAWDGTRFEFVTDFLGGGELGDWLAPGIRNVPDPDEYVRISADALRSKDGRYELRITNELEEVLYVDHMRLEAVAHPSTTEVYPNEGLVSPPLPRHVLYALRDRRPPRGAVDDHGHDVRPRIVSIDRTYPDDFKLASIRGYAESHALTIRLDGGEADVLLLTGWTDYAFSSDNVAAWQRGLRLSAPSLQVRQGGGWRTAVPDIGIPVGRPQTIVVDLRDPGLRGRREFRIVTNMRVYWDRIAVASIDESVQADVGRIPILTARLAWRGFSVESSTDGREPSRYEYARVSAVSPWRTFTGRYTPLGDISGRLASSDDRFVVARPGDELALAFEAAALPALPAGWTRTFFLYADGFSKEMDLNSASPDRVGPLPFHGMRAYPPPVAHPHGLGLDDDGGHSRVVLAPLLSLDAFLLLAGPVRQPPPPR